MAIAFTEYSLRRANDESSNGARQPGLASALPFSSSLDRAAQAPLVKFALTLNELELHRVVQLLQRGGVDISRANVEEVRETGDSPTSARDDRDGDLSFGSIEVNLAARTVRRGATTVPGRHRFDRAGPVPSRIRPSSRACTRRTA